MKNLALFGVLAVAGVAASVNASTFQCRWVERVGNTDVVIANNTLDAGNGAARRLRLQIGVFDDAGGAAPAGGFVGWNVGTLDVTGAAGNSANTRTPGRLSPFQFATQAGANGNPPLPAGDPFTHLTDIDATLGTQSPFWGCDANGNPLPQPAATVRGRNTFISVYEITTDPVNTGGSNYTITAAGNAIAASEWRAVGTPTPPDCSDPQNPVPGAITYAPFPTAPVAFTCTLQVSVPAPGAAALMGLGGLLAARRRR